MVTPTAAHLEQSAPYTLRLLSLLPVILAGKRAERGWGYVALLLERDVVTLAYPHPAR